MTPVLPQPPTPRTIDLTGLPDAVVSEVERIVREARAGHPAPPAADDPPPTGPTFIHRSKLSPEEFEKALARMAAMGTGRVLPPDWSRADIYDDHD